MKMTFSVGDIGSNIVAGIKNSKKYKLIFHTNWYWGHSVLIDKNPIKFYEGMTLLFDEKPTIDIANIGDTTHDIVLEFIRIE